MKSNIDCKQKAFVQKILSLNFVITILCFLILSGCGNTTSIIASVAPNNGKPAEPNFSQFGDIPIPRNTEMDLKQTLVLGERNTWIGRLVTKNTMTAADAYDFYFSEMPNLGWSPVTTIRGENIFLTYVNNTRAATIQIKRQSFGDTVVSIIVSPRGMDTVTNSGGNLGSSPVIINPIK